MLFIFIKCYVGNLFHVSHVLLYLLFTSFLRAQWRTFLWKDFFPVFYHNFSRGRKKKEKKCLKIVYSFHSLTEDFLPHFFSCVSSCLLYLSSSFSYFLGNLAVLKTFQSSFFRLVSKNKKLLLKNETLDSLKNDIKWDNCDCTVFQKL